MAITNWTSSTAHAASSVTPTRTVSPTVYGVGQPATVFSQLLIPLYATTEGGTGTSGPVVPTTGQLWPRGTA